MIVGSNEIGTLEDWSISWAFLEMVVHITGRSPYRALDIGCGTGHMAQYLSILTGAHVTGLERSAWAAKMAATRITCHQVSDEVIPEYLGQFDLIYCKDLLPSVANKMAFFSQLRSHLRPGGVFMTYVSSPADLREKPLYRYVKGALLRAQAKKESPEVLAILLREAGFQSIYFRRLCLGEVPIDADYVRKHRSGMFSNTEGADFSTSRHRGIKKLRRDIAGLNQTGILLTYQWERTVVVAR